MILLFSTSGIEALATLLVHGLSLTGCLILLWLAIKKSGRKRMIFMILLTVVSGIYLNWVITKDNWKNEIELKYVGKYDLTRYPNCPTCVLKLNEDNSYEIYDMDSKYEHGSWNYFDDGDVFYIEFGNGGQLGHNEYDYE